MLLPCRVCGIAPECCIAWKAIPVLTASIVLNREHACLAKLCMRLVNLMADEPTSLRNLFLKVCFSSSSFFERIIKTRNFRHIDKIIEFWLAREARHVLLVRILAYSTSCIIVGKLALRQPAVSLAR
jgi:hypothetical protein